MLEPTETERAERDRVIQRILDYVREDRRIQLPPFDPSVSRPTDQFALQSVGIEPNEFGGTVGAFRYQFEGEEDLLHLIVTKLDSSQISTGDGQQVAWFLLPNLSPGLLWLKPGEFTQHFYFGHDELLRSVE